MAHAASAAAGADRDLLLAVAMFLELNAWHYLEDSVASGHMIGDANSPDGALNNGALTATHNEYCAGSKTIGGVLRAVEVQVPPGLCDLVRERGWRAEVPELSAACDAEPARHILYGDHQIAEAGRVQGALVVPKDGKKETKDAILTENWAAALAAESYREVVAAAKGEDYGVLPAADPLADCGGRRTCDPAYTWGTDPGEVDSYECLFAWWEGDEENEHGREIVALFGTPAFRALRLVPVPLPAGDADRYPEEAFYAGNSRSFSVFGYGYSRSPSHAFAAGRAGIAAGYLLVAPRTLVPLQLGLGAVFETGLDRPADPRAAAELLVRYDYGYLSKWYFGAAGQLGYAVDAKKVDAGGDVVPLGVAWWDDNRSLSTLELRAGGDGVFGWRAGVHASVVF